jgi:hypothetical protein
MRAKFYFYRNLHTGTFSVQHKNKVVDHPTCSVCFRATFKVSEKRRQVVLDTKRKNVHAKVGCAGYVPYHKGDFKIIDEITYNPYTHQQFRLTKLGTPIKEATYVLLKDNKMYLLERRGSVLGIKNNIGYFND